MTVRDHAIISKQSCPYSNSNQDVALPELLHVGDTTALIREKGLDFEIFVNDVHNA